MSDQQTVSGAVTEVAAPKIVISKGWCWFCPNCGQRDGTWQDREMCEAAAIRHHNECEES